MGRRDFWTLRCTGLDGTVDGGGLRLGRRDADRFEEGVGPMMWWPAGTMTGWGWAVMTISMVLFWVVLILGAVLLYRAVNRSSGGGGGAAPGPGRPTPQQLLAERFARGELTDDEYRRALATLSDTGTLTR